MIKSLFGLISDIADVAELPITTARVITKPVAEVSKETSKIVKQITGQNDEGGE